MFAGPFGRGLLAWRSTRDGWPSGLRRTPGKRVYVKSVTWVRIPPHPFALSSVTPLGGALHFRPGHSLVSVVGVRCGRASGTRGPDLQRSSGLERVRPHFQRPPESTATAWRWGARVASGRRPRRSATSGPRLARPVIGIRESEQAHRNLADIELFTGKTRGRRPGAPS